MNNFIFVTGGVISSLGKGVACASIGALLESMGYKVSFIKLDPYLNVDPGTMNPVQHGEVYVTEDGLETDLDLGHYERFTNAILNRNSNITAGKLYSQLINKERNGDFLGKTIQIIPHLTNQIKDSIFKVKENNDITIVEIGGTIGDIESLPFIEAIRQIGLEKKNNNCAYVHLTYVPYIKAAGELKTKPTQHSVKELLSLGIQPNILICRSEQELQENIKEKIALFTNVEKSCVISAPDLSTIYEMPILFAKQQLEFALSKFLNIKYKKPDLKKWNFIVNTLKNLKQIVNIAIVGKYIDLQDAYKSIYQALFHAQIPNKIKVNIDLINAEELTEKNITQNLSKTQGILVPGGFGDRAIEGKLLAIKYARENNIPFLGICLGMQLSAIEFARNVLGLKEANSTEFNLNTPIPLISLLDQQKNVKVKGASMRLGQQVCKIKNNTKAYNIYKTDSIQERHRHRYELNSDYIDMFEKHGFIISGTYLEKNLAEIIEIPKNLFFVASQFHPEFQSKPFDPHPLFTAFINACKIKIKNT